MKFLYLFVGIICGACWLTVFVDYMEDSLDWTSAMRISLPVITIITVLQI